ncbi:cytoChrome c oxidase Cbb3-type, subunit I [gamma proteobacterium NOR5-3]|nr:cytoChrome c oxidase Cbb3-type, subunit I [gamma proteobacterium NOR5-3]
MAEPAVHGRSDIDKEACAWIAQFDGGEPSPADLEAFREWVNRSPRHREAIERLSSLWGELNDLTLLAVPPPVKTRRAWRSLGLGAVAAVLVLAVAATLRLPFGEPASQADGVYATAVGEKQTIVLPDGSTIQLNTATRLRVSYSPQRRELFLLAGEAFFDVAHDPQRAFLVNAGERTVRAVGTAFSIHRDSDVLEVLVTEGVVELSRGAEGTTAHDTSRVLGKVLRGQRVRLAREAEPSAPEAVSDEELTRELAWRQGMLSFSGEPLAVVVDEIGRYTNTRIVIRDASIENLRIGGYFRAGDTDTMLDALEAGFPIEIHRLPDGTVQLHARQ